jgi:MFS family permease
MRLGMPPSSPILTPAFLQAAVGNFLFFTNLSAFFLLPLHLKELGATEAQFGLIMGLYSATAIFCQPVVGAWVDRAGRRPFMVGGAAVAVAAALAFSAAPDALVLFPVLRILQGLAYSMYFVANFTVVVDLVPADRRGEALGIFGVSGLISTAAGPALGEIVVRAFGFPVFFAATAAVATAALLVSSRVEEPASLPRDDGEGLAGLVGAVLTAPRLPMALGFIFGLGLGTVFTFFPTHASALGVARIGLFAVAYSLAAMGVRVFGGRLIDTLGRRPIIIPALGLQAGAAALLAAGSPLVAWTGLSALPIFILAGIMAGAAHGFLYPALTALVMDVTPEERRGRMIGVFSAFILAGNAAGAMCFGYLAHVLGYSVMFAVLTVCLGGACVLAVRLPR